MESVIDAEGELPQLEFLFLGGNLAVDLVNTIRCRRIPSSRRIIQFDQLWNSAQARAWWREACPKYDLWRLEDSAWSEEEFELLIALRAELRCLFESLKEGRVASVTSSGAGSGTEHQANVLNLILSRGSFVLRIGEGGVSREYALREGGCDPLLAIALTAVTLLSERDLARLRGCSSERCLLLFYDSTKSGTRRWCRPECMNRSRARENYRKSKEGDQGREELE